jgi:membrane protease YdiL (CAAX protease family)
MLLFIGMLMLAISPLVFVQNSLTQFAGGSIALLFVLYINAKYIDKQDFSVYGLTLNTQTTADFIAGSFTGTFAVGLLLMVGVGSGILQLTEASTTPGAEAVYLFGLKMLLVGVCEEVLFRSYLFTTLYGAFHHGKNSRRQASLKALLVSSGVFGLAHVYTSHASALSIVLLAINGAVWCIPFLITGNIWLSAGMHVAWNFTQTLIGLPMSGNKSSIALFIVQSTGQELLTGGAYGPEAGALGVVGYFSMLIISLIYLKVTRNNPRIIR